MDPQNLQERIASLKQRGSALSGSQVEDLMNEARALLKESFQTEFEEEARETFRWLRTRREQGEVEQPAAVSAPENDAALFNQRLEKERNRIENGTLEDIESAIQGLTQLLLDMGFSGPEGLRNDTLSLLSSAANKSSQMNSKVSEALGSAEMQSIPGVLNLLERIKGSSGSMSQPPPQPGKADNGAPRFTQNFSATPAGDTNEMLASARRVFYAGDYFEAIDLLEEILRSDPGNREAQTRKAQAEDNIKRGVVPDNRVPFEARAAFGRAQSLERAGRFTEAKDYYNQALEEARRKNDPLLQNWQPAVEALLRIEQSIVAVETRQEADRLLSEDKWREAIEKYEIVLKLAPDDSSAQENIKLLRDVQEKYENARVQLNLMSGNLVEMGQAITDLISNLKSLRPKLSDSKRLNDMEMEIQAKGRNLKSRMLERAKNLINQAGISTSISERKRMVSEATKLLDHSLELAPDDAEIFDLQQAASTDLAHLTTAEGQLLEARKLLNANTDSERRQAKELLTALREYNQDPVYRQMVANLQRQFLDEAEIALRDRRLRDAESWITACKGEPFRIMGRSEEVWKLEQDYKNARRAPIVRYSLLGAGVLLLLVIFFTLGYPKIIAAIAPTITPTFTVMPTDTPAPTETPTPLPTDTPVPTPTNTPEPTPTPVVVGAVKETVYARIQPVSNSAIAFTLQASDLVFIQDQQRDDLGRLWYQVLKESGDSQLKGWVQASYINTNATPVP